VDFDAIVRRALEEDAGAGDGGVTLETIREIAASRVHSAPALDLSLLLEPLP
jgi:hypothetical protein